MKYFVCLVCSMIGYLIGHFFGQGAIAVYSSIMISYHLYLIFLVVTSEKRAALSLSIVHTILTHVACVGLVVLMAVGRHYIPFFGIIRYFIPAVAPFEVEWLFSGGKKNTVPMRAADIVPEAAPSPAELVAATPAPAARASAPASAFETVSATEYEEFLNDLRQGRRPFRKPGISVKQEFELWAGARAKAQARRAQAPTSPAA
jgi:hypothetical protein